MPIECWSQVHLPPEVNDPPTSLGMVSTANSPARIGFLGRNFHYKSIAPQFPLVAGFTSITNIDEKLLHIVPVYNLSFQNTKFLTI